MKYGYFQIPNDISKQRCYSEVVEEIRALAAICDAGGFETFWFAEHHFSLWGRELSPNPLLLAADIAARTSRLRLGLSAAIITLWHPLRIAEDIATLDHLTGGRLEFGVGRGNYGLEALNLNPIADPNDPQENFNVFDETLQIVKRALTEDRFSFKGKYYQFPEPGFSADKAHTVDDPAFIDPATNELVKIQTLPRPLQRPHPPMWIVVNSDLSIQHAAQNDCGIVMWRASIATLKHRLAIYQETHEATFGRKIPFGARTAIVRDTFVAESAEEARRIAGEPVMGSLNFANWRGPYIFLDPGEELAPEVYAALHEELTFDFVNDRALLFGSPEQVAEKVIRLHDETGIEQVVFRCGWPGLAHEHTERCVRLLRDEVIPRVNAHVAASAAAE